MALRVHYESAENNNDKRWPGRSPSGNQTKLGSVNSPTGIRSLRVLRHHTQRSGSRGRSNLNISLSFIYNSYILSRSTTTLVSTTQCRPHHHQSRASALVRMRGVPVSARTRSRLGAGRPPPEQHSSRPSSARGRAMDAWCAVLVV